MPVDARKWRGTLHAVTAADGIINRFKLHKAHKLPIAVMACPAGVKTHKAAKVALKYLPQEC